MGEDGVLELGRFLDIFNCFNARTHRVNLIANIVKNKVFIAIIGIIVVVQLLIIYYGGSTFRTSYLSIRELQICILLALLIIPIDWLRKVYLKQKRLNSGV